jgi:hypothetical protein
MRVEVLGVVVALVAAGTANAQTEYNSYLTGGSHIPAVLSLGKGNVTATLSGNTLVVAGSFTGLDGAVSSITIEEGYAGRTGPVVFNLSPALDAGGKSGSLVGASNTFVLSGAQMTLLTERDRRTGGYDRDHPRIV